MKESPFHEELRGLPMEGGFFMKTLRQLPFPAICAILTISVDIPRYCASSVSSG